MILDRNLLSNAYCLRIKVCNPLVDSSSVLIVLLLLSESQSNNNTFLLIFINYSKPLDVVYNYFYQSHILHSLNELSYSTFNLL